MYRGKKNTPSNRSRILECIYRNAPIARSEIAEETEITPATVTTTVASLIAAGIIVESEESPEENSFGRRKVPIDLNPTCFYSIGVEFTEKALVTCITDLKGHLVQTKIRSYSRELAANITKEMIDEVNTLVAESHLAWESFVGIGIAVPGHISPDTDRLITNQNTWSAFSTKEIEQSFPLPIVYENNARCMALSEYLFAPNDSPDSFAFFHVSLGMFCANMIEGEMFLGHDYMAGEIGHTIVNENGRRCGCGKYGCLQVYSSEAWLLKNARLVYRNTPDTILRSLVKDESQITIKTIATAYSMGDPLIGTYISDALKYLGIATSNIAITMNPGKIFLHGQLFESEEICSELMDYIERQLLFIDHAYTSNIRILPYRLEDGAVGASALAIKKLFIR